jgi:hypothetical protein
MILQNYDFRGPISNLNKYFRLCLFVSSFLINSAGIFSAGVGIGTWSRVEQISLNWKIYEKRNFQKDLGLKSKKSKNRLYPTLVGT